MKKFLLLPLFWGLLSLCATAQTAFDALRYSYLNPSGTARFLGAGGAFGALGAEFGGASQNPAGMAMFRSDELVVTPGLRFSRTTAALPGPVSVGLEDDKSTFGFDNFGLVFNTTPRGRRWKTFNFGIGLNRMANFNQSAYYEGSGRGSILNGFFNEARAVFASGGDESDLYPFGAGLAWNANAIYVQNGVLDYDLSANPDTFLNRSQTLNTSGGVNEMVLSFAGNYDERLMVGVTVGIPFVNYRLEGEYNESDPGGALEGNAPFFDNLRYTEFLRTEGVGVNLKMGVVYRVNQMLRLGGAFHTPTLLGLTDTYNNTLSYAYEDGSGPNDSGIQDSGNGVTDYRLRTPWRASASAAVLLRKYGFLSADVEFVDYGNNRFNLSPDVPSVEDERAERDLNQTVQRNFQQTMNLRFGGELVLDQFRLRAGMNLLGKPEQGKDGFTKVYSVGAGVRTGNFYLDLGYRRFAGTGSISPYSGAPVAVTDVNNGDVLMTLGFKF